VPSTPDGQGLLAESLLPHRPGGVEGDWQLLGGRADRRAFMDRVVVVSPDDTGISSARAKTDQLDSRTLASLLWKGELDAVWMPDERCRILRRRPARRERLMRMRTRSKNEIQALLQRRLQAKAPFADLFGVKGRDWLAGLETGGGRGSRPAFVLARVSVLTVDSRDPLVRSEQSGDGRRDCCSVTDGAVRQPGDGLPLLVRTISGAKRR
jgi:transposase